MKQFFHYLIPFIFVSLIVICGSVPLIAGFYRKQKILGTVGFLLCVAGGLFFGIVLALPLSALFLLIIFFRKNKNEDFFTAPPNPPKFNN